MTEEIPIRQSATEATSAVPSGQQGITGGARCGAETIASEINRYLYENLVSNLESQIEHWNRRLPVSQTPRLPGHCAPKLKAWATRSACSVCLSPSFVN